MMYKSFRKSAAIASAVAGVATLGAMTRASDPTDNASTVYMIADLSDKILSVVGFLVGAVIWGALGRSLWKAAPESRR